MARKKTARRGVKYASAPIVLSERPVLGGLGVISLFRNPERCLGMKWYTLARFLEFLPSAEPDRRERAVFGTATDYMTRGRTENGALAGMRKLSGLAEAAEVLSPLSGAGDRVEAEFFRLAPGVNFFCPLKRTDSRCPSGTSRGLTGNHSSSCGVYSTRSRGADHCEVCGKFLRT